jgi:hypothetical protein
MKEGAPKSCSWELRTAVNETPPQPHRFSILNLLDCLWQLLQTLADSVLLLLSAFSVGLFCILPSYSGH